MRLSLLGTATGSFFMLGTMGPVLAGLLILLNMNPVQIGVINSIMVLFVPLQLLGVVLEEIRFPRKLVWVIATGVSRLLWFLIVGLILLRNKLDHDQLVYLFVIVFAMTHFFAQLPASLWFSWMGDLVPVSRTTEFWSRRNGTTQLFTFLASLGYGFAVDFLHGKTWAFVVVVGFSALMGIVEVLIYLRVPDRSAGKPRLRLADFFEIAIRLFSTVRDFFFRKTVERDNYLYFTAAFALFSLATWIFAPFPFIYLQRDIGLSQLQVQSLVAVTTVVSFLSTFFFRAYGPRFGMKPLLIFCFSLKIVELGAWSLLNHKGVAVWYYAIFVLGGFVNVGIVIAQFSLLTRMTRPENRSLLSALFFALMGILSFSTANVSGVIYQSLAPFSFPFLRGTFGPFHYTALFNAIVYIPVILLLLRFHESGSKDPISLARALLAENPIRNVMQAQLLSTGLSESDKGKSFSTASGNFFEEEWIASLDSPSSRLRTEALLSLSRHGRPSERLGTRLAALAGDPNQGLQIQAIYAIGSLQLRSLIPVLTSLGREALEHREAHLLPAILTALGRMDDRSALPLVKETLHQKKWIFPWPFAAEALGKLGREDDVPLLLAVYQGGQIFRKRPLETKMALIALSRLLEKNSPLFLLFDREEKEPGTALGQLLGDLSGRLVSAREKDAWLEKCLSLHEKGRFAVLARWIEKSLPAKGTVKSSFIAPIQFLSGRIKSGKSSARVAEAETLAFLWLCAGESSKELF